MARLKDKVALITGAGAGIGRAAALLFAREGACIGIAEWNAESGARTAQEITEAGGRALCIETDVSHPEAVEAAVTRTIEAFGGLDVMYNNAGGSTLRDGRVTQMPIDEFWRTISVDLFGCFLGCRFAIPHLIERGGGAIINMTSIRAMKATPGADAYTAAKGGVLTLTKALAQEVGRHKIRVNAIAPGVVATERVRGMLGDRIADNPISGNAPLGYGEPEEVAYAALYLASDEARWVTGAILPVDGGAAAV